VVGAHRGGLPGGGGTLHGRRRTLTPAPSESYRRLADASSETPGISSPSSVSYARIACDARAKSASLAGCGSAASRWASGPASAVVLDHHSSTDAARYGVACAATATSAKPASASRRPSCPSSESENGPGNPGGGIGTPSCAATESKTTPSHGFCSR